jgi:hypothetical protein
MRKTAPIRPIALPRWSGIPRRGPSSTSPQSPDTVFVRVIRGGTTVECLLGQGYEMVLTTEGQAVKFEGPCALKPDDQWDVRYLTGK